MKRCATIHVSGIVQGVGFRPFVYRIALIHNLKGYVLNLGDAGVEIVVEGEKDDIDAFLHDLLDNKPPTSRIDTFKIHWSSSLKGYKTFKILPSSPRTTDLISVVPPDVGICNECISDILTPGSRWYHYPFTCCSICGPRFTVICDLPYDRERTSMVDFPLCEECLREYNDPLDRRYHAQGICCPKCGPKMFLYSVDGSPIDDKDPLLLAAKLLDEGYILAIKGLGGFHIAAKTTDDDVVLKLRKRRRRPSQPFAVMSPDISTIRKYAIVSNIEEELLTSFQKPIVLLQKSEEYFLSKWISPGLHNIGVMLPYTGIHLLLLHFSKEPALIMTSANLPKEPMIIKNYDAFKRLRNIVDFLLIHNRRIINRCDDSVLRVTSNTPTFIRRSRGFAPSPIDINSLRSNSTILAVGGELQVTGAILKNNKCFLTQHIGDTDNLDILSYLNKSLNYLMKITRSNNIDAIACDLHPQFSTTRLARALSEKFGTSLIQVQHHFAHLASLIAESNIPLDSCVVGIVIDGYGYGIDGQAWGGELIVYTDETFVRAGHLRYQPMPGGDMCTRYPARMLAGFLSETFSIDFTRDFLKSQYLSSFKYGEKEIDIVLKQIASNVNVPRTSSLGRILDAFSVLFNLCKERTYEGEPAMKFESYAIKCPSPVDFNFHIPLKEEQCTTIIDTNKLLSYVLDLINTKKWRGEYIARFIHESLAEALALAALQIAKKFDANYIGITGGVAVNELIVSKISKILKSSNIPILRHKLVPPGDGGLALGQAFIAALSLK